MANVFVPPNPQIQPNLSVGRDALKEDETLSAYVDRQLTVLKGQLSGHRVIKRGAAMLGSAPDTVTGEAVDASYKSGKLLVYQRQAVFIVGQAVGAHAGRERVLIFTASSPRGFIDSFEQLWAQWLASYAPPPPQRSANDDGDDEAAAAAPPSA
jgi:hypothetical protein